MCLRPILACLAAAWAAPAARAAEASTRPWKVDAEVSAVTANGNTKALTLSTKDRLQYEWGRPSLELEAAGLGSRNRGVVTAEQYMAAEKFRWRWSEQDYAFQRFSWDKDRFAGVQGRYDASAGVGRRLLDGAADKLSGEASFGYVHEDLLGVPDRDFPSARAFLRYTRVLSPNADFSQEAEYSTSLEDGEDYRLRSQTSLTAALAWGFSLKASFQWRRDNDPPPGFLKDDTLLSAALIFSY